MSRVERLIERARRERAELIAALLWRSAIRLKSLFLPARPRLQEVMQWILTVHPVATMRGRR
jgi:hypothetical protein